MLSIYPACFYKEKEGNYSVIFPVLGIATCGDTINEAKGVTVWVQNLLKVDFANLFVINMYLLTAFVTVFRSFANLNFVN